MLLKGLLKKTVKSWRNSLFMDTKRLALLITGHFAILLITYLIFLKLGIFTAVPDTTNVISEDAGWYHGIKVYGYQFIEASRCNLAFFPMFPYLWRYSHLSGLGISIANLLLYAASVGILFHRTKTSWIYLLAILGIPSLIFMFLPYSESLFFFFGTLIITGYRRSKNKLILIGFLGACLTRSVSLMFIPALIITELIFWLNTGAPKNTIIKRILLYCGMCVTGTAIVVLMEWAQTHKWFYYLSVQKYWNRTLQWPSFPMTTLSEKIVLGIDGASVIIGLIAGWFVLRWIMGALGFTQKKADQNNQADRGVYFSALCLAATAVVDIFFTYQVNGQTNIWSINRHILCTPFALYFLSWFNTTYLTSKLDLFFIALCVVLGSYFTGVFYFPNQMYFYFIFFIGFFASRYFPKLRFSLVILYALNLFLQLIYYHAFLNQRWIG